MTPEGNAHIASCPECQRAFPLLIPTRRRRFNPWALLWIPAVLTVVLFMGAALSHQPMEVGVDEASPSVSGPSSASPSQAPVVIFQRSGSGEFTSDWFTTPADWKVDWTYNCGKDGSTSAFFGLSSDDSLAGLHVTHTGASGSDTSWVHQDAGRHYLEVFSGCPWTVKVIG